MEFSEKLVLLRRNKGMTQTQLAEALSVTRQSVYKWESGVSYPEAMTLFAMRGLFGVSVDALLDTNTEIVIPEAAAPIVVTEEVVSLQVESAVGAEPENIGATESKSTTEVAVETERHIPVEEKKRGFFSRFFRRDNKK